MKKIEFKTGVSNVSILEDGIVKRQNSDVSDNPYINRNLEKAVLSIARPITTKVIKHTNEELHTEYVQLYEYDPYEKLTEIIQLMKHMHRYKTGKIFDPFKIIEESKQNVTHDKERYKRVKEHWEKENKVLCHNDLLLANIINDGKKLMLIDFEYSGDNSPYFDLASFISENKLFKMKEDVAYAYGNIDLNILDDYIFLNDLLWANWGLSTGHEKLVQDKIKRLEKNKY